MGNTQQSFDAVLEYLESTTSEYIDLGLKGNQDTKIEIDFYYPVSSDRSYSGRVFGSRTRQLGGKNVDGFNLGTDSGRAQSSIEMFMNFGNGLWKTNNPLEIGVWYHAILSKDVKSVNGVPLRDWESNTSELFETPYNLKLFAFDNGGSTEQVICGTVRIGKARVWQAGVLVRDLLAVRVGNTGYMWNRLDGTFYGNAGTGNFILGPDKNTGLQTLRIGSNLAVVHLGSALVRKVRLTGGDRYSPAFRVSSTKQVILAPGNLMAKISDTYSGEWKAEVSAWKFGNPFEVIGSGTTSGNYLFANRNAQAAGKWIDLFCWQGASTAENCKAHGVLMQKPDFPAGTYYGNDPSETTYDGCWNGLNILNGGFYNWRPMLASEWTYLLYSRTGSTVNSQSQVRYFRGSVGSVNGLFVLPDNLVWNGTSSSNPILNNISRPTSDLNGTGTFNFGTVNLYSVSEMEILADNGFAFLPVAGYVDKQTGNVVGVNTRGDYWTNSSGPGSTSYYTAQRLAFRDDQLAIEGISDRCYGFSVRLVRDLN